MKEIWLIWYSASATTSNLNPRILTRHRKNDTRSGCSMSCEPLGMREHPLAIICLHVLYVAQLIGTYIVEFVGRELMVEMNHSIWRSAKAS